MAILQVHQVKELTELDEGSSEPRLMQELRLATDFALTARDGSAMSTMVVQELNLWLNLAEVRDSNKDRFLDIRISQCDLIRDIVEDFSQQFLAVKKQAEAKHILRFHLQAAEVPHPIRLAPRTRRGLRSVSDTGAPGMAGAALSQEMVLLNQPP